MRKPSALASIVLCALFLGCGRNGGQTGDEDALEPEEFYAELAGQGAGDYQPARDAAELAAWSDRVVVGHAVALRAGRTLVSNDSVVDSEVRTVVLEVAVERTLKGEPADALYLEFPWSPAGPPPGSVAETRVIAFAIRVTHDWFTDATVLDAGAGLPEGETLYQITTPQGLMVENDDGDFEQPFEPGDDALGSGSFDDLVPRVVDAIEAGGQTDGGVLDGGGQSSDASSGDGGVDCGAARGDYAASYVARSGTCGDVQAQNVPFEDSIHISKFADFDVETETVFRGCTVDMTQVIRDKMGIPLQVVTASELMVQDDGSIVGSATVTFNDAQGQSACVGEYDATFTR